MAQGEYLGQILIFTYYHVVSVEILVTHFSSKSCLNRKCKRCMSAIWELGLCRRHDTISREESGRCLGYNALFVLLTMMEVADFDVVMAEFTNSGVGSTDSRS